MKRQAKNLEKILSYHIYDKGILSRKIKDLNLIVKKK